VDEFQDVSPVQYRLIKAWGRGGSIFIIGDPHQSIYGFRGAFPQCFSRFVGDYPDVKHISLVQNYRSARHILDCANAFISGNGALPGHHHLICTRAEGVKARLYTANSALSEALYIAGEISCMVGGMDMLGAHAHGSRRSTSHAAKQARSLDDIAVMYRTNRQSALIEECFTGEGIPYIVSGRGSYLTEPNVRGTLAFIKYLLNANDAVSYGVCRREIFLGNSDRADAAAIKYSALTSLKNPGDFILSLIEDIGLAGDSGLNLLVDTARMYGDMPSFLNNATFGREGDVRRGGGGNYQLSAVSLMTLHGAKGLEFPVVFLCGAGEGLIPYIRRGESNDPDEERRLFYVGLTRAKDELVITSSQSPSPFLRELPAGSIEWIKAEGKKPVQTSIFDGC
jgi:superfamily I DNA/RNA helicase